MDRRQFLALSSVGLAAGAGCTGGSPFTVESASTSTTDPEATASGAGSAASVGETVTTENGIAISVTDAQLTNGLETPDGALSPTESGRRVALARIEAQNTADAPRDLPTAEEIVVVTGGTQFPATANPGGEDEHQRLNAPVSGDFYHSIEQARPSVTASGWLVFSVPTNTESARLSWSRSTFEGSEEVTYSAAWDLQFEPDALSNIQIDRLDAPSTAPHHHEVDVILELSNTGGTEGTFDGVITGEDLDQPVPVTATLAPGESTTVAVGVPYPSFPALAADSDPREITYSIGGQSFSVRYLSPTLSDGEGVSYPSGLYLEVQDIRRIDSVTVTEPYGDEQTRRPGSGYQFIAFQFVAENRGRQTLGLVQAHNLTIVDGEEVDSNVISTRFGGTVSGAISGDVYSSPGSFAPNDQVSGWVVVEVTQNLSDDAVVQYSNYSSDYPALAPKWRI